MSGGVARAVAVLAPTGKDGAVTVEVLRDAGIAATEFRSMDDLCAALDGDIGAVVIAQEALGTSARDRLRACLERQPRWSDIPLLVLTVEGELTGTPSIGLTELAGAANLTLLERPVRLATFLTTMRAALRARDRQYEVRDHLVRQRAHEEEMREARALAEAANDAKTRFLATMSHELRTPLNAIAGYTEILSLEVHGPITAEQRADLERIERSQRYLLSLINDILNYAKIEAGHVAFAVHPFRVDPLLRALQAFVEPQLGSKDVKYSYVSRVHDCQLLADEEKTQQILLNLLSNAVKFTPPGGEISVECRADDGRVMIEVTDTGSGIPEEKREAIFEPFVQLDRSLTTNSHGTGLGLSISRDLARKMGGDLSVSASPSGGSQFTLTLPRAE